MGPADNVHYVKFVSGASIGDPGPGDPAPTPPENQMPVPVLHPPPASHAQNALVPVEIPLTPWSKDPDISYSTSTNSDFPEISFAAWEEP